MKNLITYLKTLWSRVANSQSSDVSHDCRLTVGSPSGLNAKLQVNSFMRFAVVLTLIFTIGVGNVLGADLTTADLNFGTATVTETFESVNTVSTSGKSESTTTVTDYTTYGIFTHGYIGKSTSDKYSIKSAANPMTSKYLEISTTTKGAGMSFSRTFATKGAFSFKIAKTSATFIGLYGAVANGTIYAKANSSVYLYFTGSKIQINNGNGWVDAVTDMSSLPNTFDVTVIYNNTATNDKYGDNVSLGAKRAHIFVNGSAVMMDDGSSPKAFIIPGANLTAFRIMYNQTGTSKVDDIKIYDALPTAAASGWKLKGSFDSWGDGYAMTGSGTVSVTRSLAANTRYEFKIYDGSTAYGNNGAIVGPMSGWVMSSAGGVGNCRIHTANAGEYTFSLNTSTKELTVKYPSVTHPSEYYVYFKNSDVWGTVYGFMTGGSGDFAGWPGTVTNTTTICGETYHYAALLDNGSVYNKIIFNNGGTGYGNQTSDLTMPGAGKYNANRDANWHTFDKYTISYDKGTGTGDPMESHTGLCPGSSQQLTANAFSKSGYNFSGWIADVAVTIGGSSVPAGTLISNQAAITNIQSNINLTAQWVHIPEITANETARAFGDRKVNGGPYNMTFNISGQYLTGNIGLAITGTNAGMFSVNKTSLTPNTGTVSSTEITVSYSPTGAGSHTATLTISSDGATNKTVDLTGTGKWEVTWNNNGSTSTTLVANNEKPTFPSIPSSCDATSTTFIGWTKTPWTGKQPQSYIDGLTSDDVVHTSNSTMSNVTANGTEYHAVFAKVTGGSNTISIDGTGLQEVVASITSGYESKEFNMGGYTFSASAVTKSTNGSTSGWFQLKKNNDYISIPSLPGKITNISSATIRAADGRAVSTGVYFNTSATTSSPVASQSLSSANSFSLNVTGNHTSGYILFGAATCINQLSVTYSTGSSSDYLTTCCDNMVEVPEVGATSTKNSITLSWTNVTGADGYTVTCSGGSVGEVTSSGSNRSCQITSLEANTNYTWSVLATYDSPYCGATPANGNTTTSPVYTVSYNTNGGSVSPIPATSNYAAGETVNVAHKPSTTTKGGYNFTGWNTAPNGLGTHYAADGTASFTMPSNAVVLYAEWTAKVDHFFDDMHQTTGYTSGGHIESGNYTMPGPLSNLASGNACETSHYIFVGWVISGGQNPDGTINGSPKIWRAGESNNASGATYYAVWAEE